MKINRRERVMRKRNIVIFILIIGCFAYSFSGCSKNQIQGDMTKENGIVYTNDKYGFQITLPESWKDQYVIEDNNGYGITLISKINHNQNCPGVLGFINIDKAEEFNKDIVQTVELGRKTKTGANGEKTEYVYALYYASDVNYDTENPDAVKTYENMTEDLEVIAKSFIFIEK